MEHERKGGGRRPITPILATVYRLFAVACIAGWFFLGVISFTLASGSYSITFFTNTFGEHYIELGTLLISSPYMAYLMLQAMRKPN